MRSIKYIQDRQEGLFKKQQAKQKQLKKLQNLRLRARRSKFKGIYFEDKTVEILKSLGFSINGRNYKTRFGEIDIIAEKNNRTYFIEVKSRTDGRFGNAREAVTESKLKRIKKTAQEYIKINFNKDIKSGILVFAFDINSQKYEIIPIES